MNAFTYSNTTEIIFGSGSLARLGEVVKRYGCRALLVTTPESAYSQPLFARAKALLTEAGVSVVHFAGAIPNPTTEVITQGALLARESQAQVVIGLGGGSSMDAAKAIAVEATHPGSAWDYLFFKQAPTDKTLPVIAVSTTSGTGSQVTQVSVLTNEQELTKSAIYNDIILPKVAIIDPALMLTAPASVTAMTGFDALTHAFESMLHPGASPYTLMMAREAVSIVVNTLPALLQQPDNLALREEMAWADTLGGLCIKAAGVTLPHGQGMAIGGLFAHVAHGEALAIVYPAFIHFTWQAAPEPFAFLARLLSPALNNVDSLEAASQCALLMTGFLQQIGLKKTLQDVGMPASRIEELADASMVLPDYKGNPRVASRDEMIALITAAYYGELSC